MKSIYMVGKAQNGSYVEMETANMSIYHLQIHL